MFKLVRKYFTDKYIIGDLYIGSVNDGDSDTWVCNTLEPSFIARSPCIPCGTYKVDLRFSPKFKKLMPTVLDVDGRSGILVHPGNSVKDTKGCILVGYNDVVGGLLNSKRAFDWFYSYVRLGSIVGDTTTLLIKNK